MSENDYQIIFEGKLLDGFALESVKKNIAALFKMNDEQVNKIFGGSPVIIKKNTDEQTALKYQAAFRKAGAKCQIHKDVKNKTAAPPSSPSNPAATPVASEPSAPRMIRSTRDIVNINVPDDLGELSLAAPGGMILAKPENLPVFNIDISHLTLAELESGYLVQSQEVKPTKIPDISNLKLEPLTESTEN